eukprot:TRINITY_DN3104_c0_g1_i4.p2 TRINITY_DN3104_c0_g1~~TRINITY_DN3104_c0_g1_i4.p2  ORF type:complete len:211 (-),score=41.38 TRINITY_DN3104_c0_g1_i4:150-782(-)
MNCLENNTTCIGGKKLFACEYPGCDQVFRTKFSCKRHTLTHTKEKPHTCEECGKKFSLMQHLKEHSYRHSKQKPYVCGVDGCTQSFRHASELSLHRRTHSDYKLRKYKFFKPRVVAEKPAHKASKDTLSEGRDDGKTFDSNKKPSLPQKIKINLGDIPTRKTKMYSDDVGELDTIFLRFIHNITVPQVGRPVLPLPAIYGIGSTNASCYS